MPVCRNDVASESLHLEAGRCFAISLAPNGFMVTHLKLRRDRESRGFKDFTNGSIREAGRLTSQRHRSWPVCEGVPFRTDCHCSFVYCPRGEKSSICTWMSSLAAGNLLEDFARLHRGRNSGCHNRPRRFAGSGARSNSILRSPACATETFSGRRSTSRADNSSLLSVHRSRGTPPPRVRKYFRSSLVLDGDSLRLRLSGSGRADRAAARFLLRLHPAARCWPRGPDFGKLAERRGRATCRQIGRRVAANLVSLSADRQKSATLVALLRPRADSGRFSGFGCVACVGQTADNNL